MEQGTGCGTPPARMMVPCCGFPELACCALFSLTVIVPSLSHGAIVVQRSTAQCVVGAHIWCWGSHRGPIREVGPWVQGCVPSAPVVFESVMVMP